MRRRGFSAAMIGALAAAQLGRIAPAQAAAEEGSAIAAIRHWVVVMFENRSFDALLGHLPHIPPEDGLIGRDVALAYPGGTVRLHPSRNFTDPIPDPGEAYANMNVQLFGRYDPASNAGKAAFAIFPDFMSPPFNAPAAGQRPSMDGFALDYFHNARWQLGRDLTEAEMQSLGGMFTPATAPVINALARNFAVFTNWHCDVPTCTFPNRSFFLAGTSNGRIDNELTYDYAWDNDLPNIFTGLKAAGRSFTCYFPESQVVPLTAINLAGLKHLALWREHSAYLTQFHADCANGALPDFAWVEPKMLFGETEDYHPPTDIRAAERFLADIYEAVRNSPQWEETALVIMFDESGGCYDHVPPPAAVPPGGLPCPEGFAFDRLGPRLPTIVISAHTAPETVLRGLFMNTSMTRTLTEQLALGQPLTPRVASAATIEKAFNLAEPRRDRVAVAPLAYVSGTAMPGARQPVAGDIPTARMLEQKYAVAAGERLSEIGEATCRNAARLLGLGLDELPRTGSEAQDWLARHFRQDGVLSFPEPVRG